jgi:BolA protein
MRIERACLQVLTNPIARIRAAAFAQPRHPARAMFRAGKWSKVLRIMTVRDTIAGKLTQAFAPVHLEVIDQSHLHAGHAGARADGQTHFSIHIVSQAFHGKSRIERHRMVNDTLASELAGGVHALAIRATAPDQS